MKMRISERTDSALLHGYATTRDEDAFAELVQRHLPMVYSAAARRLGDAAPAAEDVSQGVFLELARKASELTQHPVLAGWLYLTATRLATAQVRALERRQRRETLTMNTNTPTSSDPSWPDSKPFLDDAMQELADEDRHAMVLRYFQGQDFASVGRTLGLSADAARMRVARGLEKLRSILKRKGVASSVVALEALLLRETVVAVPATLAVSIGQAVRALPPAVASVTTLTTGTKLLAGAMLLLLLIGVGTMVSRAPRTPGSTSTSDRLRLTAGSGDAIRQLRGRPRIRPPGAPVDPKLTEALGYLRSALFNTALGRAERGRLLEQSAGMLVGLEGETIAIFREAFNAQDPEVVWMAIEGIGRFGMLPREFGPELLGLLENPAFKEEAGLIANRLLPSILVSDNPVQTLLSLMERRPDLSNSVQYLLTAVIGSNKNQLAANREAVEAMLQNPNPEIQAAAKAILNEAPEAPPVPTVELSRHLTTALQSDNVDQRQRALLEVSRLHSLTPEIREALATVMRQDSSVQARVDARVMLELLAPNDPALRSETTPEAETARRELMSRLERNEVAVPEMLAAIADRSVEVEKIVPQLSKLGDAYWDTHLEEKNQVMLVLGSLHRDPDARVYEAVTDGYARLMRSPRPFYTLEQLEPYFATMESALSPGEYAITMRDLKSSLDSYWQARGFQQGEPTHLPKDLVQVLLVGPQHQNRRAYDAMLRTMREIDPAFEAPR